MTETGITPERDPDDEEILFEDENGPAFRSPGFADDDLEFPEGPYSPYEEPLNE